MTKKILKYVIFLFFLTICSYGQTDKNIVITVSDTTYHTIERDFYGIQYHINTYTAQKALDLLASLELKPIRIWAEIKDFHPGPEVWYWEDLDQKIEEITAAGYTAVPGLWGEEWFIGSPDSAWWNYQVALTEWENAAYNLADRYKDKIDRIIIFDELNMLYPDKDYYIPFKKSAQLYIKAAQKIKSVDPDILCGGPSGFGGWENGHWANYVLNEPNGSAYLDFISSNIFLSWDSDDSDKSIMDRTIWYEEAPLKMREMLGDKSYPELVLNAYNLSALWKKDGKLWTDPRNTNILGGIYQAAVLLHSAKGGFDITMHWETIGGFGILNWYPEFKELAPFYSWKFLIEIAGLTDKAQIIGCTTSETPKADAPHHGGMNVNLYTVQPFAIRRSDGGISIVLINKYSDANVPVTVNVPDAMKRYATYRYDETRITDSFLPLEEAEADQVLELNCPPYSVSIIRFETDAQVGINEDTGSLPAGYGLLQNYPNPFNLSTSIEYLLEKSAYVLMRIYNQLGQEVNTLVDEQKNAGNHKVVWDGKDKHGNLVNSGIYYIKMQAGKETRYKKMVLLE